MKTNLELTKVLQTVIYEKPFVEIIEMEIEGAILGGSDLGGYGDDGDDY